MVHLQLQRFASSVPSLGHGSTLVLLSQPALLSIWYPTVERSHAGVFKTFALVAFATFRTKVASLESLSLKSSSQLHYSSTYPPAN